MSHLHHMSLPAAILQREFWLYVWKVGLPNGNDALYVGMTGDTGVGAAQSAMNRVSAHLGRNVRSNALRRYLKSRRNLDLEACRSLDFYVFGPVYPKPSAAEYPVQRGRVAAIEKELWKRFAGSGFDMLNAEPKARAEPDRGRLRDAITAFQVAFPNLGPN